MKTRWQRLWQRRSVRIAALVCGLLVTLRLGLGVVPHAPLRERLPLGQAAFDTDGNLLGMTRAGDGQWRYWVPLAQMSPQLIAATLLYEDRWFRWHVGVNPASLARAAWASATGTHWIGASTITMQLARRLSGLRTRSGVGKLRQIATALWLDARFSKDEILEAYLNTAPYGGDLEGVFAASYAYFGLAPSKLMERDAMTLAVIPQNPNRRGRPAGDSKELRDARALLWQRWKTQHATTELEDLAMAEAPPLRRRSFPMRAPHFVRQVFVDQPGRATIQTTIDGRVQALVEQRLATYFRTKQREGLHNAAVVIVDHRTAEIRALVGSANFWDEELAGQVDGTRAYRSPGSTLKPFVYALGLEQGQIGPETLLYDVPIRYPDYAPENFDRRFVGPIGATDALVSSRNIPAVELMLRLEKPTFYEFLQRSKISRLGPASRYGAGLALGAVEVTLQEIVTLYTALAHGGELRKLKSVRGAPQTSASQSPAITKLLTPEASYLVLDMLSHNPRPNRLAAVMGGPSDQIAWKTGTSWGFRDAWTIGVVGPYVIGLWVGDFKGRGDPSFTGLRAAAPIFFDLVEALLPRGGARFTPPQTLEKQDVCSLSGALPNPNCPHRKQAWFWPGHSPIAPCTIHQTIRVDEQKRRACDATRGPTHDEVVEHWSSDLRNLFAEVGLPRRSLPPPAPECIGTEAAGAPPRITSPIERLIYAPQNEQHRITLTASVGADAREVFWYAGKRLLGRANPGQPLHVQLEPGKYVLLAVDNLGRSDTRQLVVAAPP